MASAGGQAGSHATCVMTEATDKNVKQDEYKNWVRITFTLVYVNYRFAMFYAQQACGNGDLKAF